MTQNRSFKDYIAKRFDNKFWEIAERYLQDEFNPSSLTFYRLHRPGQPEIDDVKLEHVWVDDLPGMDIQFDVALSLSLSFLDADHHYDNSEEKTVWLMVRCRGNLERCLDDFVVCDYSAYNGKTRAQNPLDDSLVPYIAYDQLEKSAHDFLTRHYPEALAITPMGKPPIWVDPSVLAERLGLTVKTQRIREDASVFGQIFFENTDMALFDAETGGDVETSITEKTILVDPLMYLLRNLGSVNNTIIHECVHWDKHRKAFALEKLFNPDASFISCEVVGGAGSPLAKKSTEFMERQANQLAPRIQMPAEPFRAKAKEYITRFMREADARHTIDVMETVIRQLESDFGVSKQAAKIRLVELGIEEAVGTFTYLDGHYVKPHSFRKGAINLNQTFSIGAQDAAVQRFVNPELRKLTENGDYLFVDNHYVYNAPLYVESGEDGKLELTGYARAHMDECCLAFDMAIVSKVSDTYHTACFLNREPSDITFDITYHNGYQNSPQERQVAMRKKQQAEWLDIRKQMTDDPEQCMELLLNWRSMKYTELGDAIDRDPKTISRTVNGQTAPSIETVVRICFGLHLPPTISEKLLEVLRCPLKPMDPNHQWIKEALYLKYPESLEAVEAYLEQFGVEI
ncbi:MAG: ImmA/IrrE family metallo-endopeptidase [Eubacteriales bacterium]|nr:ImmA/IrrE family metallo-endopeptidase [Eubacteriales bacterium]